MIDEMTDNEGEMFLARLCNALCVARDAEERIITGAHWWIQRGAGYNKEQREGLILLLCDAYSDALWSLVKEKDNGNGTAR